MGWIKSLKMDDKMRKNRRELMGWEIEITSQNKIKDDINRLMKEAEQNELYILHKGTRFDPKIIKAKDEEFVFGGGWYSALKGEQFGKYIINNLIELGYKVRWKSLYIKHSKEDIRTDSGFYIWDNYS